MRTQQQIVDELAEILRNFQGREYSEEIGPQTLFFGDLGFVSIDAVVLGETLESFYQQEIPFNLFLTEAGRQPVTDIEVGQLAEFLHRHLAPQSEGA
jgi:acyl carrier protein